MQKKLVTLLMILMAGSSYSATARDSVELSKREQVIKIETFLAQSQRKGAEKYIGSFLIQDLDECIDIAHRNLTNLQDFLERDPPQNPNKLRNMREDVFMKNEVLRFLEKEKEKRTGSSYSATARGSVELSMVARAQKLLTENGQEKAEDYIQGFSSPELSKCIFIARRNVDQLEDFFRRGPLLSREKGIKMRMDQGMKLAVLRFLEKEQEKRDGSRP